MPTLLRSWPRALLAACLLSIAAIQPCLAVDFPEDAPVMTVTVPANWKSEVKNEGLRVYTEDQSFIFMFKKAADGDPKDVVTALAEASKTVLKDPVVGKADPTDMNGMKAIGIDITGKDDAGAESNVSILVFNPADGVNYSCTIIGSKKSAEKYGEGVMTVLGSLKKK